MNDLIYAAELLISGLLIGLRYAMVALGFVLIYKASGVFNFAQGAMTLFAALTVVGLMQSVGLVTALVLTAVIMAVLGVAIERIAFRPLIGASPLTIFMATVGVGYILEGGAQAVWGTRPRGLDLGLPDEPIVLGGVFISQQDLYAALASGLFVVLLILFFYRTKTGLGLRAIADDSGAAQAAGVPLKRVWAVVWALAGLIAIAAGVLWGSRIGVHFAMSLIALKALPVLIIGGIESIGGVIIAGLIVGAAESLGEGFLGPLVGGGIQDIMAYLAALLFLFLRPNGLFGQEAIKRV